MGSVVKFAFPRCPVCGMTGCGRQGLRGPLLVVNRCLGRRWIDPILLREAVRSMALARPDWSPKTKGRVRDLPPLPEWRPWPTLWAYLTDEEYSDGSPRERSTLTFFIEDGQPKACLSDRQEDRTLWVSASSLQDLIVRLEALLATGKAEWRDSRVGKKGGQKK